MRRFTAVMLLAALAGCRAKKEPEGEARAAAAPSLATPVRVSAVARETLSIYVSGPGKTAALVQQKVRAPFAGTLTELRVNDGDPVRRGQAIGSIVARDSEAALSGAREMLRQARTPAERRDAERALVIARQNLVRKPLIASWNGAVVSHEASAGDRVAEDQEILTIEDASSVVFLGDVPQSDLAWVHAGQRATVEIAGAGRPLDGVVHAILPGANPADFTGAVRVDLPEKGAALPLGLFGTVRVLVGEHEGIVVPDAAVLRDDVSGVRRLALVTQNRVHWVVVTTGLAEGGRTEILSPPLTSGQPVIVGGLVGLPEGKTVSVAR